MSQTYGYSPRILPFGPDVQTGFTQNRTLKQVAIQNFINLVLCAPGERLFEADFGVGLRNYLFEMNDSSTRQAIKQAIVGQTATYLPYIRIEKISFQGSNEDRNLLKINIFFEITSTEEVAGLSFMFHLGGGEFQIVQYDADGYSVGIGHCDLSTMSPLGSPSGTWDPTEDPWGGDISGCFTDPDGTDWSMPLSTFEEYAFDEHETGSPSIHEVFSIDPEMLK